MATTQQMTVRMVFASPETLFREAMQRVLADQPGVAEVAVAGDGRSAGEVAQRVRCNVAVLDLALRDCDGLRACCQITASLPSCRVLILACEYDVDTLARCLRCGAAGFLTKDARVDEVMAAVRAVLRGETLVPHAMLGSLLASLMRQNSRQQEAQLRLSLLTRREREVLGVLVRGATTDEIAGRLTISRETARTHVQNVLSKLGVHSRLEAAAYVSENDLAGLLPPIPEPVAT